jgi:hypothetical protein
MWPFTKNKVYPGFFVRCKYTKQVGILFDLPQKNNFDLTKK